MKTVHAVVLISVALLVFGCTQKVNDPADVQAIKDMVARFDKAVNAGDAEAVAADHDAAGAMRMEPNQPALVNKEAIRSSFQKFFDQYTGDVRNIAEDIRVSGDLAVARGTYEEKSSLKAGGYSIRDKGKWATASQRQPDGTWKCFWVIWNSDLPVAEALRPGQEEMALLQLEREWSERIVKKDLPWLEQVMSNDLVSNVDGQALKKAQLLADLKSGAIKFESSTVSDMKVTVFGDRAVVQGIGDEKSSNRGKDTSGRYKWTDIFAKRDGRWQWVCGYSNKIG